MLLTHARRGARVREGHLVPLDQQDRGLWNRTLIREGHAIVRELVAVGRPGQYQLLASINAVHTAAESAETLDWASVVRLYDQLMVLAPTPVHALNRAVALEHVEGPVAALAAVDQLGLTGYHPWHVARAHLLEQVEERSAAALELQQALSACTNPLEQEHLTGRLVRLQSQ